MSTVLSIQQANVTYQEQKHVGNPLVVAFSFGASFTVARDQVTRIVGLANGVAQQIGTQTPAGKDAQCLIIMYPIKRSLYFMYSRHRASHFGLIIQGEFYVVLFNKMFRKKLELLSGWDYYPGAY